ncbi:MAG: YidC/Oxa1 family insertase periplasmic-domain containing protein [Pirellulales bacterium]
MQRNFVAFLVLSFGVLVGWMILVDYLQPRGMLDVTVADGVDGGGVKIVAKSDLGEFPIDLSNPADDEGKFSKRLPAGEYDLTLEGDAAAALALSKPVVRIEENARVGVQLIKRPEPKKADVAKPAADKTADGNVADDKTADDKTSQDKPPGDKPDKPDAVAKAAPVAPAAGKVARQHVAIGSIDPDGAYRQLWVFDGKGGAVERIELASHRYHDLEDDSGYLGHFAPADAKGNGAIVGVVGAGTPGAAAGLKAGDTIVALAGEEVEDAAALEKILAATRPGEEVEIGILRDGKPDKLRATLVRHPMQIVRPELENRQHRRVSPEPPLRGADDQLSFILGLTQVGDADLDDVDLGAAVWSVTAHDESSAEFQLTLDKLGLRVTKRYELAKLADGENDIADARAYHVNLKITIEQLIDAERKIAYRLDGPTGMPTEGWWYSRMGMRDYFVGFKEEGSDDVSYHLTQCVAIAKRPGENDGIRDDPREITFAGVNSQYFAAAVIPKHDALLMTRPVVAGEPFKGHENLTNITCRLTTQGAKLSKAGDKIEHKYELFAGPKRPELLASYGIGKTVDYGMWAWAWIAKLLQGVLHTFYAVVGNYGLAILMLTVMVRLIMFPLSRKQVRGAMKMQELQPEMKRINEMYKKDLEARNRALSQLFRKHNYHPLSGCLPIFIQLPIFIGLYNSLWVDIELRQAPLFPGLDWCSNLAAPDMLHDWTRWMPDFVLNGGLFGMLPPAMGPYLNVLPIVTVALMIVQQKMFTPPPTNDQAEMQQKIMKYMMVIMCFLFYKVASGLCLYFICSSTWGLAERKLMPKPAPKDGAAEVLLPPVKSKSSSNGSAAKAKNKKRQKGR